MAQDGSSIRVRRYLDFRGSYTVKVVKAQEGAPTDLAFLKTVRFDRKNNDMDRTWLVYFDQDKDSNKVTEYRKDPSGDGKIEVGCMVPGAWFEGMSYVSVPLYGLLPKSNTSVPDDQLIDLTKFDAVVAGSETIKVKCGNFQAWKVSRLNNTAPDMVNNVWFAPELGYFLKMITTTPTGNSRYPKCIETMELSSTTIPIPARS
ncbi:MAG TPA: hypothetical protein VGL56_14060 [Fimbriimonadaceae bacterium]|jgi:hypothetical protein